MAFGTVFPFASSHAAGYTSPVATSRDRGRTIGVLAGGDSPERAISFISGDHVYAAFQEQGRSARLVVIGSLDDLFPALEDVEIAFNCLHGGSGEDGTVQLLLDLMGIPYAGSDARACARAMDKAQSKAIFETLRIPTPPGRALAGDDVTELVRQVRGAFPPPFVVKPVNLGSTIGVTKVERERDLAAVVKSVAEEHGSALVEPFVAGRELTVGILRQDGADRALPVVEILFPRALFDYEAKYSRGVAEFVVPAKLPEADARRVQDVSLRAHHALGCSGFSRVDLRLGEDGEAYVLEVNTLPGMTPMSDLPRAAAAAGIPFGDLVEIMLATAERNAP
jgi:D-alanine-D-alanine ligase